MTLVLGIVLAELLLGLESAFDFTNIRIWPLHLGGVFGLATILIMIGGLTPNGNELSAVVNNLLRERSGDAQKKVNSLSHLIQTLSLVGVTFALLSVGLMAFARTVY